jgi:hypothetical protein
MRLTDAGSRPSDRRNSGRDWLAPFIRQVGADAVIDTSDMGSIVLRNVPVSDLSSAHFVFA